ncbi:hypothetical protein MVEN_01459900 [Mycena venus]|uniref:Uncharacterized protein n=1 Tax=Mycena venus TaxID=2733690 RepID=A0A8H6XVB2_9AGAR|nr:hypothetical protein MVEN_01459900 [Mycena venus]
MPVLKRKYQKQRSGLKQGGHNGPSSKKSKVNKENFTVYVATVSSDSESEKEPPTTFSSLPVHGTHFRPVNDGPEAPPLRSSDTNDNDDILPYLEPISDDEGDDDEDIQADDEGEDDPQEELDELMGLWEDKDYAELYNKLSVPTSARATAFGPATAAEEDEDMPFEPSEPFPMNSEPSAQRTQSDSRTSLRSASLPPVPDAFANPWARPNTETSTSDAPPPQPNNPWLFSFTDDLDDQYLEEYSEDGDNDDQDHDDARYESVDEEEGEGDPEDDTRQYTFTVPSLEEAQAALKAINLLLRPPRNTGAGYKKCELHLYTRTRLEWMATFLHMYCTTHRPIPGQDSVAGKWNSASLAAAHAAQKGPWTARRLRQWTRAFLKDPKDVPTSPYGSWNKERSVLEDADVANEIALHLQSLGKYVKALDIVHYIDQPEVKKRLGLKKGIHLATAQHWMKRMGYRWTKNPSGQYVDGHERADVVYYRQKEFIPAFTELEYQTRKWTLENLEFLSALPPTRIVVIWFHDESTFYVHDRRLTRWVHHTETPEPRRKGEGASLMVSDFVSADYGWLRSRDGTEATRVLFKAGKKREGYFTNEDIIKQTEHAMDILSRDYGDEKHVFIFDNATTHTKRAGDALSARKMPKFTPKNGKNFLVSVNKIGDNGKPICDAQGDYVKIQVRMRDGTMLNGSPQPLYFPAGHEHAGIFKGMAVILKERGLHAEAKLNAQCKNFKCATGATSCCCRRVLYNQPDFRAEKSLLEKVCEARGFRAMFLPKFHCELNFLEQCWGASKRVYRMNPVSSKEEDLERNVIQALDSVSVAVMRRYANRSLRFLDAYRRGLNGRWAAYVAKEYRGHRVLPYNLFDNLRANGYTSD